MIGTVSRRGFGVLGVGLLVAPACHMAEGKAEAERAVLEFHRQLDASDFAGIYAASHTDLKKATPEKDLVALLEAVHRKLGTVHSSTAAGSNVFSSTSGTTVKLGYKTSFSDGDGMETFTYRIENGKALLLGYNINSMALITK